MLSAAALHYSDKSAHAAVYVYTSSVRDSNSVTPWPPSISVLQPFKQPSKISEAELVSAVISLSGSSHTGST